jgi:hypothetical protein
MADTKAPRVNGWDSLVGDFADGGLNATPLRKWSKGVRKFEDWQWGTRTFDPGAHYGFLPGFIYPLLTAPVLKPRFMVSHAGHGMNSYSINVHIVTESAIVFTQAAWGGVFSSGSRDAEQVNDMMESVAAFLEHSERIPPAPEERHVLIMSNFRGVHVAGTCAPGTMSQDEIEAWFNKNECEAPGWFW